MTHQEIQDKIEAIRQASKDARMSQASALKFLIDAGIISESDMWTAKLSSLEDNIKDDKGSLVLNYDEVVLLEGVMQDDLDAFYIMYNRIRGRFYSTCVGKYISLKSYLPKEEYNLLISVWNLNNPPEFKAI